MNTNEETVKELASVVVDLREKIKQARVANNEQLAELLDKIYKVASSVQLQEFKRVYGYM